MTAALMKRRELAARADVHPRTLERWGQLGIGPRPIRLSERVVRYDRAEAERWLAEGCDRAPEARQAG